MEFVKEAAMYFGFVCAGLCLFIGLYFLFSCLWKKLEFHISNKVAKELKGLLPRVNQNNDGCFMMVVDGRWRPVRIDNKITIIGIERCEGE